MKKTNICPKCSNDYILRIPGTVEDNVILPGHSIFSAVKIDRYVCMTCGFTENYVQKKADLEKLEARFGPNAPSDHALW